MSMTEQEYKEETRRKPEVAQIYKRAVWGFGTSLLAGFLVLINGIVLAGAGSMVSGILPAAWSGLASNMSLALGGVGIVLGLLILLGSGLIYYHRERAGGVLTLVFSVLSIAVGGGFFVGEILGVSGGSLAIARK